MLPGLFYWHRFRGLGFVPVAITLSAIAGWWAVVEGWGPLTIGVPSFLLMFASTRVGLYLVRFHRHPGLLVGVLLGSVAGLIFGEGLDRLFLPGGREGEPPPSEPWLFAILTTGLAIAAWARLFRPMFELAVEPFLWMMYRIRSIGPSQGEMPPVGPCLVIANHACWLDPVFLGKVLPRPLTPMMTDRFYDLPVLRWLMKGVFGTIRVPDKTYKIDAPEIQEAIAALDRGQCVLIFPEGVLRRSEEKPLRRFGRGVWQILVARPNTPVFACWIEGGWGSYTSYFNGKPAQNKRPDFRRPIGVGVAAPITMPATTLENHLRTRIALMNHLADSRKLLGLPELAAFELPEKTGEDEEEK
jgi:1-acyl-sn-glycerol-3-phosphate acyltransferase